MAHTNYIQIALAAAGSQARLSQALGVSQQAVSKWLQRGWAPAERAAEIEFLYGVPRRKLMNPRLVDLVDPDADLRA